MTANDPFNHPMMGTQVDAEAAASALGEIFRALSGSGGPAAAGTVKDPLAPTQGLLRANDQTQGASAAPAASGAPFSPDLSFLSPPPAGSMLGDRVRPVPEGTRVSGEYGENRGSRAHPGIDFAVPLNTQLLAAASGTVSNASNNDPGGYGFWVEITTDDGFAIRYGHMAGSNMKVGDKVRAGQIIGVSGGEAGGPNAGSSTGPHLHFEVRADGHAIDPTPFLAGGYQVLGGPVTPNANPGAGPEVDWNQIVTTPDPKVLASIALKNVIRGIAGEPLLADPGATATGAPFNPDLSFLSPPSAAPGNAPSKGDNDPGSVDAFLAATRQHESGGNYKIYNTSGESNASGAYQFIGTTWRGMGGSTQNAADASPAEQDAIARKMAMQLFDQFRSWRLVAIAWYGGPAVAQQEARGSDPGAPARQGGYRAYGDTIVRMMSGG